MEVATSSADFRIQTDRDPPNSNGSYAVASSTASAVLRKIEFQPAKKPFNGFSNGGSDFKIETLNPSSGNKRVLSAPSVKKSDSSDVVERGFDPELTFSITFRRIGAGLQNLGNTCFLNSVLQCLTYTEPLAATLQTAAHQKYCHVAGFCALCAIQKHVRTARQANGRILAPKHLVSNLRCISRNFRNCRQEDAHEYMINLLECMHKCSLPSGVPSESSDAYRRSLVHNIFGGSLRSQVKYSLQRALLRFTAVELLDDGAKVYQCERCRQKVKAKKQLTVSKAPYVLTIHLKRFEAHRSEKIDRKVQFTSAIDMKPFVSGPCDGNLKYTLYGVLVHYGRSIHSGHYACFVRTSTGMWYSLDDNRVIQVSDKTVFDQKAYMLFYVRDRQNAAPKNAVPAVNKDISKESLATNKASLIISSNLRDQVNGSSVLKKCGLNALVTNGSAPLKSCDLGTPTVLTQGLNAKETQKNPLSSVEAKESLKRENGSVPLKTCDLAAPTFLTQKDLNTKETLQKEVPLPQAKRENGSGSVKSCDLVPPPVLSQKDLNTKETLQKEAPLSQANGEGSLVKEDPKAACEILPGKVSPLLDGSTNAQVFVNLPTSAAKAERSVDEENSVNNLSKPANSLKVKNVSIGNSPIEESGLIDQTLGQHPEESATSVKSIKSTSAREILTTPIKTRKHNTKSLQVGLKFFKLSLGLRKNKKQKRGRSSSTVAVKIISEELLSKKRATDQEHSTSQITSEVVSGSTCTHGKDNSVSVHSKSTRSSNGNMLFGSPTGELKERTNQNGSVLASNQQQPSGSSDLSEASQNAKRKRESSVSLQKESMDILTRGVPETVVAKWGEDVSASEKMRSKSEGMNIGYVADEWDEEYDRGKKKKIRMKEESYDGPNPFQMVASNRLKEMKKKWTQRLTSAKTAFRI
ncbi:Ubiquitin carboxyl-terminal hydrolase 23 [Cardamine amara subsp. amara]|uniref:Ubiquitin carboxyl-terminal hydrolase n=1 Tax=Cardamine amara subsp. amara TaxID=228776 RepID=A0ABD1BK40_CARAN